MQTRKEYWVEHSKELPHGEGGHWVAEYDYDKEFDESYEILDDIMEGLYDDLGSSEVYEWVENNYTMSDLLDQMQNGTTYDELESDFYDSIRDDLPYVEEGEDYEAEGYTYIWVWDPPEDDGEDDGPAEIPAESPA